MSESKAFLDLVTHMDDGTLLTFWRCEPCQTRGATPDSIRQPPVWVSKAEQ
jgi:hypothetical protein